MNKFSLLLTYVTIFFKIHSTNIYQVPTNIPDTGLNSQDLLVNKTGR